MGREEEKKIDFKGRDFYDLIWYMEEKTLPNEEMLKLKGMGGSVGDVFDEIALFISKRELKKGLKKDLEPLFLGPVDSFVDNFRNIFQRLREKHYINRRIKLLDEIRFNIDFHTDINFFRFNYLCENETRVSFLFKLSDDFFRFSKGSNKKLTKKNEARISWETSISEKGQELAKAYMALFLSKIETYLKKRNNEVYFTWWESKLIKMTDDKFNSEKEIVFFSGQELTSNKKITLETLSL